MKTGYDQFFKNARKVADQQDSRNFKFQKKTSVPLKLDLSSEDAEKQIRRRMKMGPPKRKQKPVPWKMIGVSFVGFALAVMGFQNYEEVENILKRVEFQMNGEARAESAKAPDEKAPEKAKTQEPANEPSAAKEVTNLDVDHLQKLNERKKELDAREEELNRLETELTTQKTELDKRLKDLEEMRTKISSILEDRVKIDQDKLDTLVQLYSNMKAPQAAKVFETMDEDLAVDLLGRMKKKNAADIMNLLKAEKAQVLSEMFAGYKRNPASTGK